MVVPTVSDWRTASPQPVAAACDHLGPVVVVLHGGRVGLGVGQHGAVGVDDGQALVRRGLAELAEQLLRLGDGALGVHQDEQLLEGLPGGAPSPGSREHHR